MVNKEDHQALVKRVEVLEKQVEDLLALNSKREEEIKDLQGKLGNNEQKSAANGVWSNLPKQAAVAITQVVTKEKAMVKKKENNVIITGVKQANDTEQEKEAVNKLFASILKTEEIIDKNDFKVTRYKNKKDKNKPGLIMVEFTKSEDKDKILKSTKQLRSTNEYKEVFINRDLTENELAEEKRLRDDRRIKNSELQETDEQGFKYGWHKFGNDPEQSKFYWGVRNGEVKKIKCRTETNRKQ